MWVSSRRVPWKETINGVLTRATGYQLQRAGTPAASRRAARASASCAPATASSRPPCS